MILASCCLLTAAFVLSCSKDDNGMDPDNPQPDLQEERKALAAQVADHHILPAYQQLTDAAADLSESVSLFENDPTLEHLESMQAALRETWLAWQYAAIYQMGPTENNTLRAIINLYPCDTEKVENNIEAGNYTLGSIANQGAEGLPALDYLLHADTSDATLKAFLNDNQRLAYLKELIETMDALLAKVEREWLEGPFLDEFKSDQASGTDVGSATGLLINAMDQHFQRFLRDGKVAIPAGVRSAGVPRPTAVESLYSGYSKELLQSSLNAYQQLMKGQGIDGVSGTSLYAYLEAIEQAELVEAFDSAFAIANQKIEPLTDNFREQIELDEEPLVEVFLALQEIVTLIKSDMASVLGITITNQDNDGD